MVHASFDAAQDVLGFLDGRYTMPACGQLLIREQPEVLLCLSPFNDSFSQSVTMSEIAPTQGHHLTLGLVQLHDIHLGLLLKLVHVASLPSLVSASHPVTCYMGGET